MNLKSYSKNWSGLLRRRPRRGGSDFISPRRDWLWTLALAVIIFLLGAAGLGYHFFTIQNMAFEEVDVATTLVRYRQADVQHFLAEMDDRTKAHEALRAVRATLLQATTPSATSTSALPSTATSSTPVGEMEESGGL